MSGYLKQKHENSSQNHKRFQYLESFIIWQGSIQADTLKQHFQINSNVAALTISQYKSLYPGNLTFNGAGESYEASNTFELQHASGTLDEYISLKSQEGSTGIDVLTAPIRNVNPELVQPILKAISQKQRLGIGYASVSNPDYTNRIIQPHNLVFDGLRWHVRAYCEKNSEFRDFVLSRFKLSDEFTAQTLGEAKFVEEQDEKWNNILQLEITPDPRLDEARTRIIAMDYDMEKNQTGFGKVIEVRAALLMYLMQRLRLDRYHEKAEAQQIIVSPECQRELKAYL